MPSTIEAGLADRRIAALAALAVGIHLVEAGLPSPLPGVKPGLANVITILVLMQFGWRTAAWVSLLRVIAGSLLTGTFLGPTFLLSAGGALASLAVLGLAWQLPAARPGAVGLSVLAGVAHVAAQVAIAWWLFIPHAAVFKLAPVLYAAAVVTGTVNGIIAALVQNRVT